MSPLSLPDLSKPSRFREGRSATEIDWVEPQAATGLHQREKTMTRMDQLKRFGKWTGLMAGVALLSACGWFDEPEPPKPEPVAIVQTYDIATADNSPAYRFMLTHLITHHLTSQYALAAMTSLLCKE